MIEFVMIFALGALAATLVALSALPALDRRAQRLSRRRLEALFPLSIAEIAAERDHVRAAMAVEARRTELKAEAAAKDKAADLAAIGRRDLSIHALSKSLAERDADIARLQAEQAKTTAQLADAEARLAETTHVLSSLRAAHQELSARHQADALRLGERTQNLGAAEEKIAAAQRRLADAIEANAELRTELRAATSLAAERQLAIAALEAQLETAEGEARDLARKLATMRGDGSIAVAPSDPQPAQTDENRVVALDQRKRRKRARPAAE